MALSAQEIFEYFKKNGITPYKVHKHTGLNQSSLILQFNKEKPNPRNETLDLLRRFVEAHQEGSLGSNMMVSHISNNIVSNAMKDKYSFEQTTELIETLESEGKIDSHQSSTIKGTLMKMLSQIMVLQQR